MTFTIALHGLTLTSTINLDLEDLLSISLHCLNQTQTVLPLEEQKTVIINFSQSKQLRLSQLESGPAYIPLHPIIQGLMEVEACPGCDV